MDADTFWCEQPRDVLMVHGPDAAAYLHSQLSQELRDLALGEARWSFLLEPTGRVDALVRVLRSGDAAFVLDVDAGQGDAVAARLLRFRIRVKADVEPVAWRCLAVRGPGAGSVTSAGGAVVVPAWGGGAIDLLGPDPVPPAGVREGTPAELEAARVRRGWPAHGAEIGENTIPAETGLLADAVSFTKGCYPGQELVERMDSRAAVAPQQVRRVTLSGAAVPGDAVVVETKEVGRITSVAGSDALALVRRSVAVPGAATVAGCDATVDAIG